MSAVGTVRGGRIDPPPETAVRVLPSRLTPRIPRAGIVERRALVKRLCRTSERSVIAVVAPGRLRQDDPSRTVDRAGSEAPGVAVLRTRLQ
jgi:hypothetical protein